MHHAPHRIAQNLALREPDQQEILRALIGVVGAHFIATDVQPAVQSLRAAGEEPDCDGENDREDKIRGLHVSDQPCALAAFTAAVSTGMISNTSPTIP